MVTSPKQYRESPHQQEQQGKRGKPGMRHSGKDTHLEAFCMYFYPRVLLCSMSSVTASTASIRGEFSISQKAFPTYALYTLVT